MQDAAIMEAVKEISMYACMYGHAGIDVHRMDLLKLLPSARQLGQHYQTSRKNQRSANKPGGQVLQTLINSRNAGGGDFPCVVVLWEDSGI
jgi:hypothetical protein